MENYYIIYHGLIAVSLILSFVAFIKGHKRFFYLVILLLLTLIVELIADNLIKKKRDFVWLYHAFNFFEYALFSLFLIYSIHSGKIKKAVIISIPIFVIVSLTISFFFYRFIGFPGININIEGFLLFMISIYILYNLDIREEVKIFLHPDFWMCIGLLIFFGCTFMFNGLYTSFFNLDKIEALNLFGIINKPLNIILYSSLIIGTLCLILDKRHTIR